MLTTCPPFHSNSSKPGSSWSHRFWSYYRVASSKAYSFVGRNGRRPRWRGHGRPWLCHVFWRTITGKSISSMAPRLFISDVPTQLRFRINQIIAGLGEVRRNNLFGYTAFCLYGGFWMSVATIEIVSLLANETPPTNKKALQGMLFMVSVFTYMLWTLTFKMNYTISSLFFLLGSTCMLLSFGTRDETVDKVGGWFGVATSINAFVSNRHAPS